MGRRIVRRSLPDPLPPLPPGLPPVLARVYAARHVSGPLDLDYGLARLHPPEALGGIEAAAGLLADAVEAGRRVLVVGDFDADGATSSALVVRGLRAMGARHADYLVPNRFEYGYGLTPEVVAAAAERRPDLIVTVDNGISSLEGVRAARSLGIRVLVTDHHLAGPALPEADAIVNPNCPGDRFPSKHLAGVGVAFYLMAALRAELRRRGGFARRGLEEPNLAALLDLVALGTVADVVPLDHNNRVLVARGLARVRAGHGCPGIRALARVAGRDPARLTATDLGFALGPRLNAAGRLADMSLGVACLLAEDDGEALRLARELDALNAERRAVEAEMHAQALVALERVTLDDDGRLPAGLCLFDPDWHPGVVGILASRIKERVHRPVVAFAPVASGELRGSGRSLPSVHLRDALEAIDTTNPGLLARFGGHAMAAGVTLAPADLAAFAEAFDREVRRRAGPEGLAGVLLTDGVLAPEEMAIGTADALREGGPWGQGFPEPIFDGEFQLVSRRVFAERHLRLGLRLPGPGRTVDAVSFNALDEPWPREGSAVRIAYRLDVDEWQGSRNLRLVVEEVEPPG
ncbi:MAG: single-stranded-DNA-specific exonuclease RecJ [Gammaproteobacteria bacterium]|jgi:single-stranded-DNA-specific exonuclease|nr:single-stranded-DNA-specific exonuclease RecJ [Gammaproteobacteria bacterium]